MKGVYLSRGKIDAQIRAERAAREAKEAEPRKIVMTARQHREWEVAAGNVETVRISTTPSGASGASTRTPAAKPWPMPTGSR